MMNNVFLNQNDKGPHSFWTKFWDSSQKILQYVVFFQNIFKIVARYGTGDYINPIKYLLAIGSKTDIEIGDNEPELEPEETDVPDAEDSEAEDALFDLD